MFSNDWNMQKHATTITHLREMYEQKSLKCKKWQSTSITQWNGFILKRHGTLVIAAKGKENMTCILASEYQQRCTIVGRQTIYRRRGPRNENIFEDFLSEKIKDWEAWYAAHDILIPFGQFMKAISPCSSCCRFWEPEFLKRSSSSIRGNDSYFNKNKFSTSKMLTLDL